MCFIGRKRDDSLKFTEWIKQEKKDFNCYPVEIGLKIKVRDFIYEQIINDTIIMENFKLNVKRLNRWWYSVYFDKKCNHNYEPIIFGEKRFCSECREIIK